MQAYQEIKHVEIRRELRSIFEHAHAEATAKGLSGPLPFGAELVEQHVYDPCPPCGMARIPAASRKLMRFLAR